MTKKEQILRKLKRKYPRYSIDEIRTIVDYQFKFVSEHIKQDGQTSILLHRLGTFSSPIERRNRIIEHHEQKQKQKN